MDTIKCPASSLAKPTTRPRTLSASRAASPPDMRVGFVQALPGALPVTGSRNRTLQRRRIRPPPRPLVLRDRDGVPFPAQVAGVRPAPTARHAARLAHAREVER